MFFSKNIFFRWAKYSAGRGELGFTTKKPFFIVLSSGWLALYSGSVGGVCITYHFLRLFKKVSHSVAKERKRGGDGVWTLTTFHPTSPPIPLKGTFISFFPEPHFSVLLPLGKTEKNVDSFFLFYKVPKQRLRFIL